MARLIPLKAGHSLCSLLPTWHPRQTEVLPGNRSDGRAGVEQARLASVGQGKGRELSHLRWDL